jgi:hypothetical protein
MDEAWCCGVSEVKGREIKEVDNKYEFTRPEVAADPEHNEAECQKVVLPKVKSIKRKRTLKVIALRDTSSRSLPIRPKPGMEREYQLDLQR